MFCHEDEIVLGSRDVMVAKHDEIETGVIGFSIKKYILINRARSLGTSLHRVRTFAGYFFGHARRGHRGGGPSSALRIVKIRGISLSSASAWRRGLFVQTKSSQ